MRNTLRLLPLLLTLLLPTATHADGWFPKFNPSGTRIVSGAGELSLDGAPIAGAQRGWNPTWIDDTRFVYNDDAGLTVYDITTKTLTKVFRTAVADVAGGGGAWAAWGPNVITRSTGSLLPGAGGPWLNRGGQLAYVSDRQAQVKNVMVDGTVIAQLVGSVLVIVQGVRKDREKRAAEAAAKVLAEANQARTCRFIRAVSTAALGIGDGPAHRL